MSKRQPQPCAQWAEQLAQASFGRLSTDKYITLRAHLAVCPACAAVRADYLHTATLLRQAPDPDPLPGLPPQLLQAWAAQGQRASARRQTHAGHLQEVSMQTIHKQTPPSHKPTPPDGRRRLGHHVIGALSAVAAVLVIAVVIAALVASHAPAKPSPTGTQPGASTATQPDTSTVPPKWQALPHLTNVTNETWFAPSNPRVVYQIGTPDQVLLRRSDDAGATWHTLPTPPGTTATSLAELYISPTNAQHILAEIHKACPSSQTARAAGFGPLISLSDGHTCSTVYFSRTGGASWAAVTFPTHGSANLFLGAGISAQENRLYTVLVVEPGYTGSELVVSRDDGATWQFADQGLNPMQHCLLNVITPRTGTTLFATTQSHCGSAINDPLQLWRSADAGATWTQASSLPLSSDDFGLQAVNVSGQALPVLIDQGADGRRFSLDSGKTWQPIPALAGQGLANSGIVGILSDGSIVEQANTGFFAWKPGDSSWHQVAPALDAVVMQSLVAFDAKGKEALYLGVRAGNNAENFYSVMLS